MSLTQKKTENKKSQLKLKIMLSGLMAIMLGLMLVACGENTATVQPGSIATVTPASTTGQAEGSPTTAPTTGQPGGKPITAPATSQPQPTAVPTTTNAPVPTTKPSTTSAPVPTATNKPQPTPTKNAPAYNPVIKFSASTLKVGDNLTISGSGYPASIKIDILLSVPDAGLYGPYASLVTDENGKFTTTIKLATYPYGQPLPDGRIVIKVSTIDNKYGASASVTLTDSPTNYKPVLEAAPQNRVKLGGNLTLNGSDFPANLKLQVVGGVQSVTEKYGNVVTDAKGRFSLAIKLPLTGIYPGVYLIFATSESDMYQAKLTLDVYAALTPVLETSKTEVSKGDEITLSGSGYPANTDLQVIAGVQNPNERFGTVRTDAQGSFQLRVKLTLPSVIPGPYFIYASTEDFVYQANVKVTVKG